MRLLNSLLISYLYVELYNPFSVVTLADQDEITMRHDEEGNPCIPGNETETETKNKVEIDLTAKTFTGGANCVNGFADGYPCTATDLGSFLSLGTLRGGSPVSANDVWGWSSGNRDFAFIGLKDGTAFADVTDPDNAKAIGFLPSHNSRSSSWGDMKTYKNYMYKVSETNTYLQIFDLNALLAADPNQFTIFTGTVKTNLGFSSAHNIVINEDTGYAYTVGSRGSNTCLGLHVININNPMNPVNEGCFSDNNSRRGYTHDAQCIKYDGPDTRYTDREICFGYNENMVVITDVTNKNNIQVVSTLRYNNARYVHQGWLTEDREQIMINDEGDSGLLRIIVADVSNLRNPRVLNYFNSDNFAIDHNLYVKGNYMYHAQYSFGLAIYSLDDIAEGNLERVAHFDTFKSNDNHVFEGAWSTYPYFNDGKVVISSIGEGLFVVKPNLPAQVPTQSPTETPLSPTKSPSLSPPDVCGDGICNFPFENKMNCDTDCAGIVPKFRCGDGICHTGDGEDCNTCPEDCNGDDEYCCGDGTPCSDGRCRKKKKTCTRKTMGYENWECVDMVCSGKGVEDATTCQNDCTTTGCCGDGVCNAGEDCESCPQDCRGKVKNNGTYKFCCGGKTSCSQSRCRKKGFQCTGDAACTVGASSNIFSRK
jgi:choice-of-anchor B domain-containing protein